MRRNSKSRAIAKVAVVVAFFGFAIMAGRIIGAESTNARPALQVPNPINRLNENYSCMVVLLDLTITACVNAFGLVKDFDDAYSDYVFSFGIHAIKPKEGFFCGIDVLTGNGGKWWQPMNPQNPQWKTNASVTTIEYTPISSDGCVAPEPPDINDCPTRRSDQVPSAKNKGDPIDLGSLALVERHQCLNFDGKGVPIKIGLRYDTRAASERVSASNLSRGWVMSYGRIMVMPVKLQRRKRQIVHISDAGERYLYTESETEKKMFYPSGRNASSYLTRIKFESNEEGRVLSYQLQRRDGASEDYRGDGSLKRITDAAGNRLVLRPPKKSLIDPGEATLSIQTYPNGVSEGTDDNPGAALKQVDLVHVLRDGQWLLEKIQEKGGGGRRIELYYDGDLRVQRIRHADGSWDRYEYNADGLVYRQWDGNQLDVNGVPRASSTRWDTDYKRDYDQEWVVTQQRQITRSKTDWTIVFDSKKPADDDDAAPDLTVTEYEGNPGTKKLNSQMFTRKSRGAFGLSDYIWRVYNPNSSTSCTQYDYKGDGKLAVLTRPSGHRTEYAYGEDNAYRLLSSVREFELIEARTTNCGAEP